jgi:hypothetical protein
VVALLLAGGLAACGAEEPARSAATAATSGPTGAAPTAPPGPVETYADGDEQVPDAPAATDATGSPAATPGGGAATAEVVITFADASAGAVVAGGYVLGVVESDGECTLSVSRGGTVLTGTSPAYPDASTTSCSEVRVALPAGASGDWRVVLSYGSSRTTGESAPATVSVR